MRLQFPAIPNKREKVRFGAIGLLNTAVDFGLYSVLSYFGGIPLIIANFISTSAGFLTSFFLNRRFTFNSQNERRLHEFFRFLGTTLVGLWILQPAIIFYCKVLLGLIGFSGIWVVVLPKALAIVVGLVWNYLWYSRYVFPAKRIKLRDLVTAVQRQFLRFVRSDFGLMLTIAVLWQVVMSLIGIFIQYVLAPVFLNPASDWNIAGSSPLIHIMSWDGGWYWSIVQHFYHGTTPATAAFYPLLPFGARLLQVLTLDSIYMPKIALIFNTVCLWLGLVALLRICQLFFGRGDKRAHAWTTVLFLSFPAAFFLHQFYTEALFIALGFWAYYFALKRRWAVACVCLAFLTATRVTSVLFIGLVGMEYWRAYGWSVKKAVWNPKILWFLITPLGFLAYSIYLRIAMGDFLGMFHAYRYSWQYQKFNPHVWVIAHSSLEITYRCTVSHFAGCSTDLFVNNILPLAVMAVLIGLSILAIVYLRGRYVPLGLLGIASWLMFSLNGNWVSVYRYALPVATLYLVTVGLWKKLRLPFWLLFPVVQLCFALQMLLLCLYINGYFAG